MENVYDIRRKENLNMILSDQVKNNPDTVIKVHQMAIIVHLHYSDTVEIFFEYLKKVPEVIDIYVSTSEAETKQKILSCIEKYHLKNCSVVDKQNRGRDISALLVACRSIIEKYEYFCFLHDKKGKHQYDHGYKWDWVISMWNNMIASEEYIYNVKNIFDEQDKIGVLAVPEPFYMEYAPAVDNAWYKSFEQTKGLAQKLQLNCRIDYNISPITLGTVFWCRRKALKKLFSYPWRYEDFDKEPLANDGTTSHAVERIFAYVAQDAGYLTGNIRTIHYAERNLEDMQYCLRMSFGRLRQYMGIWNFDNLLYYDKRKQRCVSFAQKHDEIYLFGAGMGCKHCLCMLREENIIPKAILVTQNDTGKEEFMGIPLVEFVSIPKGKNIGIIIAVDERFRDEIARKLEEFDFYEYMWMMERK